MTSKKRIVGYSPKKTLVKGTKLDTTNPSEFFVPIYEDLDPLEELIEYAYQYAHLKNDMKVMERVGELAKEVLS